jgi:hypothetical protein
LTAERTVLERKEKTALTERREPREKTWTSRAANCERPMWLQNRFVGVE